MNDTSSFPIYIPSKGRSNTALTCLSLDREKMPYFLITTPEEASAYSASYAGVILPIQGDGMKMGQIRNLVLDDARQRGFTWIWMIDDDVINLFHHGIPVPFTALRLLEQTFSNSTAAQAGFAPGRYNPQRQHLSWNGTCNCIVAIQVQMLLPLRYDSCLSLYEDTDFTLQLLLQGHQNIRDLSYSYTAHHYHGAKGKPCDGGLSQVYSQKNVSSQNIQTMAQRYGPKFVKVHISKNKAPTLHVLWAKLHRKKETPTL